MPAAPAGCEKQSKKRHGLQAGEPVAFMFRERKTYGVVRNFCVLLIAFYVLRLTFYVLRFTRHVSLYQDELALFE
jgi:hypothetical protein